MEASMDHLMNSRCGVTVVYFPQPRTHFPSPSSSRHAWFPGSTLLHVMINCTCWDYRKC